MEFIRKLYGELMVTIITILVGIGVVDDMDYDYTLSKSYWYAFIMHPYRFIKHKGNPIDKTLFLKYEEIEKKLIQERLK